MFYSYMAALSDGLNRVRIVFELISQLIMVQITAMYSAYVEFERLARTRYFFNEKKVYPKVKVRQEDDPPEFQRICFKDFQSLSLHDHPSTKAAKHDKDGKTPPHVRAHKSHISDVQKSLTRGKITKKVAEDSKPNKVSGKVADEYKPSSVLPPRAVLSSPENDVMRRIKNKTKAKTECSDSKDHNLCHNTHAKCKKTYELEKKSVYPKVKVRQEDDPPEFQRICLKDLQSSTKAAKHDKDGKTPPHVRAHKSHISDVQKSPTRGKITKKVAEDSKPNKVSGKVADEYKPSSVLPPRAVLSSPENDVMRRIKNKTKAKTECSDSKDHNLCHNTHAKCKKTYELEKKSGYSWKW
nr:Gnk2-homologous domain-containing protein [Tanacetum cinerariifolium]